MTKGRVSDNEALRTHLLHALSLEVCPPPTHHLGIRIGFRWVRTDHRLHFIDADSGALDDLKVFESRDELTGDAAQAERRGESHREEDIERSFQ